jgi:hypothetical protein
MRAGLDRAVAVLAVGAAVGCAVGCAATSPVLVEPRTPEVGIVRAQVGAAALAPIGGDASSLANARDTLATPAGNKAATDPGVAEALAARPGVAPFVRGVVGIAPRVEGTLRYGGRDVSAGVRWTFVESRTENAGAATISIGGDGRAMLRNRPEDGVLGGVVVDSLHGYGGTIPLIAAWQSDAGLLLAYAAALVGFDGVGARVAYVAFEGDNALFRDASIRRWYAAGTLGLGIGFRRVHVIMELGLERDWLHSTIDDRTSDTHLWSLAPAGCISVRF